MTITIMYLYYDLFNLYGESGNVKAIKNYLEALGIDVKIKFTTLNDDINLKDVDLIYLGMSTEENQKIVINHINKYKKEIKDYIENNGYIISTGNSIELFGKCINKYETLNIFDYETHIESFRLVDEALFKCNFIEDYILGFINRNSVIKFEQNSLFKVIKGIGNYPNCNVEGINYKNFYGTYLIGPILIRNPKLLSYLMNKLIKEKDEKFELKEVDQTLEIKAYNEFMKNYYKDYIKIS